MNRTGKVFLGIVLIAFGLVFALGSPPVGIALCVAGAAVVATAAEGRKGRRLPPADDPRWTGALAAPQVAGRPCAACARKIVLVIEGELCALCDAACHRECMKDHERTAHKPESEAPYR